MPSGVANEEKARVRQLYAQGKADREELLESEAGSYHAPGTCTFYGTANSNQMLMEVMGLHLPGAAFVPPEHAAARCTDARRGAGASPRSPRCGSDYLPLARHHRRAAIVNAIVGLLATGGSTNHTHAPGGDRARRRHRDQLGRLQRPVGASCRCWRASIRTAAPT